MNHLSTIIEQNRRAVILGVGHIEGAVGTKDGFFGSSGATDTTGHSSAQGGLRGHSIGEDYPFSVVVKGIDPPAWVVTNLLTGKEFESYTGVAASEAAHQQAHIHAAFASVKDELEAADDTNTD